MPVDVDRMRDVCTNMRNVLQTFICSLHQCTLLRWGHPGNSLMSMCCCAHESTVCTLNMKSFQRLYPKPQAPTQPQKLAL